MSPSETLKLLGRPIAYHPRLAKLLGSVNAAILFGQFVYWSDKTEHELGIYKTAAQIEDETGLSAKEQETARKKLKEHGVLHETHKRLEHRLYFRIDFAAYDELVCKHLANSETENTESPNDESPNDKSEIPETQKGDSGIDKSGIREATNEGFAGAQMGDSYKGALDYNNRLLHKNTENIYTGTAKPPCEEKQTTGEKKLGVWAEGLALLTDKGVDEQVAKDFIAIRKSQKAPLTMTALGRIEREANKAGWTLEGVIRLCAEKGWRGFEAKWLLEDRNQPQPHKPSVKDVPLHTEGGRLSW
ncbi:hypothetical protein BHC44_09645 [Snodgrassella alvi]|nr:hypothetical protein BHC44_09645 [Snodgrassella alvi]